MSQKNVKYLKDYISPNYLVTTVDLTFTINEDKTVTVNSQANYSKNPKGTQQNSLLLSGSAKLESIALNNQVLSSEKYHLDIEECNLYIENLPEQFSLSITTIVYPWLNKSCMGLYESNNNLFTQCEPHGFSKITYYQDRPDVMASFSTTIIMQNLHYAVALSNGNKVHEEITESGQRIVKWVDPFKKPCYLFALVVGNLGVLRDTYITKSKRQVQLEIYTETEQLTRAKHAMESVKRAMQWDEERFNLEYDLDIYMLVATSDFNMGAMENKGLNIFNTKYLLADKDTATDADYVFVELVIGHEYFHNWTGNRVTCRDWFQLSLKEGLTVFRDQEFSADMHSRGSSRIKNVKTLRQLQFTEDNGPLAHSVRPESYIEINNFYTTTVYKKGAEVVRMYQSILGNDGFNKGLQLYLNHYDGQAATCEDFCQAMAKANAFDLSQFMLWYSQAGTPQVNVTANYNPQTLEYSLNFKQFLPDTPGQSNKKPMLIPINTSLFDSDGHELENLELISGKYTKHNTGLVLLLTEMSNTFVFKHIKHQPVPSLLRGFSAPIKLEFNYTEKELLMLATHDSDEFNRYECVSKLFSQQIKLIYMALINKEDAPAIDNSLSAALRKIVENSNLSPEFRALALQLPGFSEMLTQIKDINPILLAKAINYLASQIGELLFDTWIELYNINLNLHYDFKDHGKRSLKNIACFYICSALTHKLDNQSSLQLIETMALGQYHNADNMTDQIAVLTNINHLNLSIRNDLLHNFYDKWQNNELVMDKWFAIQASSQLITIEQLNKLLVDKAFIATNPNKIYALLKTFVMNGLKFHNDSGYAFIADQIIAIDHFNPQVASTLASGYSNVIYLQESYRTSAKIAIQKILARQDLSGDVYEVLSKILLGLGK